MKPDVLITWPSGVDYPLCRLQLRTFRKYFNDVILTFYPHGVPDFTDFVRKTHKEFKVILSTVVGETWREKCVLKGLENSKSDEVLFTEQDFFFKDEKFLERVNEARTQYDIVGIKQGNRLHPCFLRTSRKLVDLTSKDFSVQGDNKDHFQKFSEELLKLGTFIDLKDLGLFEGRDWYHFSSMTWNLFRIKDENTREMHEVNEFLVYNAMSRTNKIPQDRRWELMTFYTDLLLTKFGRFLNQE